jgi:hypothetical protein
VKDDPLDIYDSYDREALRTAAMLVQLTQDVIELYSIGVELNDPTPSGGGGYDQPMGRSGISDPTGEMATNPRRHQRANQLKESRLALAKALKEVRHAMYNSAAAAGS